ncbi:MAG TPA: twin-arginine translocase subunit TatC, partial [Anaerolineae bacterium]|nr:twin-arginine translocase subunit TatC [Anaerolineae bacterium]
GLENKEKRYVRFVVPGATVLFLIGVGFAWSIMLPAAIGFLSTFQSEVFKSDWRADAYIPFVTSLMFWIGVSFEMPLIVFFLAKLKLVTAGLLLKGWRFAVVGIAVIAAVITPTVDPFNMMLVMAPLILLYFFSILLAKLA